MSSVSDPRLSQAIPDAVLPAAFRQPGAGLLHQQCWYWGCDIRRKSGNLLLEYGFVRHARPPGSDGSSAYVLSLSDGSQIGLWAFGLLYADTPHGVLYLNRYEFQPRLPAVDVIPTTLFSIDQLPPCRLPENALDWNRVATLFPAALRWLIAYETWVLATVGLPYREACLAGWNRRRQACPPDLYLERWRELTAACSALYEARAGHGSVVNVPLEGSHT